MGSHNISVIALGPRYAMSEIHGDKGGSGRSTPLVHSREDMLGKKVSLCQKSHCRRSESAYAIGFVTVRNREQSCVHNALSLSLTTQVSIAVFCNSVDTWLHVIIVGADVKIARKTSSLIWLVPRSPLGLFGHLHISVRQ